MGLLLLNTKQNVTLQCTNITQNHLIGGNYVGLMRAAWPKVLIRRKGSKSMVACPVINLHKC